MKTDVIRYLEEREVSFRLLTHKTPATSIQDAARQRGISPGQMVKSILLRDMDNNYALACVPGDLAADPKKVRAILNCRRMTCVSHQEAPKITGYQLGAITPLLLKTAMPIFFDQRLLLMREVTISSGSNMAGLALMIDDLVALCQPRIGDIVRDPTPSF